MWRFWRWPLPPTDPLVAMALLVRGVEKQREDWQEIIIKRRPASEGGGVVFAVR